MEHGKTPKIRFHGFNDNWEVRKLGEVAYSYSGGTPQVGNSEYYNGEIPFIRSGEIYNKYTELFITQKGIDNSSAKMVSKGDILYALYGATSGEVNRACIDGAINQAILAIIPNKNHNADFIVEWFRREKNTIIDKYIQGGQGNLSAQIIKNLDITFPTHAEQQRIGEYFSRLDDLIGLYKRKLEKSLNFKKAMLAKMFPQNGKPTPQIRFAGFNDNWEVRKLPEFVNFFNGLTYSPNDIREYGTLVLRSSNVKDGEIVDADNVYVDTEKATSEKVQKGDIIVVVRNGSRALIGKHAEIKMDKPNTVIGAFMTGIRSNNYSFVNALLNTSQFENEIEKNMGATINQITGYMFEKMIFIIPQSHAEQQRIGEYFSRLDDLIGLYKRKLEKSLNLKKAMLEKMFP